MFGKMGLVRGGFGGLGLAGNVRSASWTPLNLGALLAAWWDAQDAPHIALNVSNVTSWTDKVAGIVASQATPANQPTFSATARNGKPGITCVNTSSQNLAFGTNAALTTGTTTSFLAVAAFAVAAPGGFLGPFGYGAASAGAARGFQKTNTNVVDVDVFGSGLTTGPGWNAMDIFIEGLFASGTTLTGWADGTIFGPGAFAFNTTVSSGTIGAFVGANMFGGVIQQIIVLNAAPSTSQRQKLEGWESWYDGKAGSNLPGGHPYKSRAPFISDP